MTVRVAVGICAESGRLLMGKRFKDDGFYGGYWEFPGGKIEAGETPEEALKREFREELDAEVTEAEFLNSVIWTYPKRKVELNFFLVRVKNTDVSVMARKAHSELEWLTKEEALSRPILPANVSLIRDLSF